MSSKLFAAAVLTAALVLGLYVGSRRADAACNYWCHPLELHHSKTSGSDNSFDIWFITNGDQICRRIYRVEEGKNVATGAELTRRRKKVIGTGCVFVCYAIANVHGQAECNTYEGYGEEENITCWERCADMP